MEIQTQCGGEDCDEGMCYLPNESGLDTCSESPPKCSGTGAVDIPCQCSDLICENGEYCYDDTCNSQPQGKNIFFLILFCFGDKKIDLFTTHVLTMLFFQIRQLMDAQNFFIGNFVFEMDISQKGD